MSEDPRLLEFWPHPSSDSSRIGLTISSVTPGYTVDSRITVASLLMFRLTISAAFLTKERSGSLDFVTGVGTQMIIKSAWLISLGLVGKVKLVES